MKTPRQRKSKTKPALQNFDVKINEMGEIVWSHSVEEINTFLDKNHQDKKLTPKSDSPQSQKNEE